MTTFQDFYAEYPRKKARGDAAKAWQQAIRKGYDPDEIIQGLRRNIASMRSKDPQFVPYPATWLRAESWFDEPDVGFQPQQKRTLLDAATSFGFSAGRSHVDHSYADGNGDTAWNGPGRAHQLVYDGGRRH